MHQAVVLQVELLVGGELTHGSARLLEMRGWGLLVDYESEEAAALADEGVGASCAAPVVAGAGPSGLDVATRLGDSLEMVSRLSQGRGVGVRRQALSALAYGHRVAFFEIFCGEMHLTLGVRAQGLCAPDGIDSRYPLGGRRWDLTLAEDRERCAWLVDELDPLVTHTSPPRTKHSSLAPRPAQPNFDAAARRKADGLIDFSIQLLERRALGRGLF